MKCAATLTTAKVALLLAASAITVSATGPSADYSVSHATGGTGERSGATCKILDNVDLYENNIGNVPGPNAESCVQKCLDNSQCSCFSWSNFNGGTCWLKTGNPRQIPAGGVRSGLCRIDGTPAPSPDIGERWQYRGVNLGGIFVIEPWITPSLFYQFQEKPVEKTAIDNYRFCEVLGAEEANRQLKQHWETFVTEEDIVELASYGINAIRLPVGDWQFVDYQPYNGCYKDSLRYVDRIIGWCGKHGLSVFLDLHATKGGQNGFDNGGKARRIYWTGRGEYTKLLDPAWMYEDLSEGSIVGETESSPPGNFVPVYSRNQQPSWKNLDFTTHALELMAERYAGNKVVVGVLDVINEPWQTSNQDVLKQWYKKVDDAIKKIAPHWQRGYSDSFKGMDAWVGPSGLPTPRNETTLDVHIYEAWVPSRPAQEVLSKICDVAEQIKRVRDAGLRVIVGEWSSATDTCTLWLNGWNQGRVDLRNGAGELDACGSRTCDQCTPMFPKKNSAEDLHTWGMGPSVDCKCPITADAPKQFIRQLYARMLYAYAQGDGWFFWNFKAENDDIRWNYLSGVRTGVIPKDLNSDEVRNACSRPCVDAPDRKCSSPFAYRQVK